ncbi:unnamed protein product [Thlaspi arvense]|uniref:Uncharacterized protein n=1 Tax=Thlaspi arvense TaxID=13288 RepID=A0AAU9RT09_THLAR|nr:unnamed protein product [Thlaspi arvense]
MKKMYFIQMAVVCLIIAVVAVDVMKRSSVTTVAAELFSLAAAMTLVIKLWVLERQNHNVATKTRQNDKVFMINARDLSITWSDDPEYWSWLRLPNEKPKLQKRIYLFIPRRTYHVSN